MAPVRANPVCTSSAMNTTPFARDQAAIATIRMYQDDGLVERAREIEAVLLGELRAIQAADPRVGDVRGRGAMIAIELVEPGTNKPDAALTSRVVSAAHAQGVILLTCGTYGNVIRFLPPLTISDDLLRDGISVLREILASS
jgi:4-aminobutyrate aminotransferase/(S)-3-amino-2-methylpropionate transaminase